MKNLLTDIENLFIIDKEKAALSDFSEGRLFIFGRRVFLWITELTKIRFACAIPEKR